MVLAKQNILESGWSHHHVAILRSPRLSIRFSRVASTCRWASAVPQPLRASRSQNYPKFRRASWRRVSLAALPVLLPNILGVWGRQRPTKSWNTSEPCGLHFLSARYGVVAPGTFLPWAILGQTQLWASGGDAEMEWAWKAPDPRTEPGWEAGLVSKGSPALHNPAPALTEFRLWPQPSTESRDSRKPEVYGCVSSARARHHLRATEEPGAVRRRPGSSSPTGTVDAPAASAPEALRGCAGSISRTFFAE